MKDINLVLQELEKHKERLLYALNKIESFGAFDEKILEDHEKVETMDAFLFRFSKMQDTMGEKLFPLILEYLGEDSNKPFIDILNRLEKLEFLPSSSEWKELRKIRNLLMHTYPWETKMLVQELKEALYFARRLVDIYDFILKKLRPYTG